MPNCCQGASCDCRVLAGDNITVVGTGQAQDPFVISASISLGVTDNSVFNLTLIGDGSATSPWNLQVAFAATAKLDDLPDVNAGTPTNGDVLSWDAGTETWVPAAPTTAPTGAVTTDDSLAGDGSVGSPLEVQEDPDRFLTTTASGLGLSDEGIGNTIRHFTDSTARALADPPPDLNSLSMLDTNPGRIDFWNGSAWEQAPDTYDVDVLGGEFLDLSGPYVAGARITHFIKQVSATSDGAGIIDIIDAPDLVGFAGVVSVQFQETGSLAWSAVAFPNVTKVSATAYHLTDGTVWPGQLFTGIAYCWLYS